MSIKFRINALIVAALPVLFYLFFMTAKHDPALSVVNAFADDPFDAIGSFGVQAAVFLGLLSLVRGFRPYRAGTPTDEQKVLLARTQLLAVLAVVVTLVSDVVTMARYPSLWVGLRAGRELAALLGGLALLAAVAGALAHRSIRGLGLPAIPNLWKKATIVCLATVVILAFYPDDLRQSTLGGLFTVVAGAIFLFAPMWAVGMALVPCHKAPRQHEPNSLSGWLHLYKYQLAFVTALGILMGLFLVLGESREGGARLPLARLAFVASVYVFLESAGVLIGYLFLTEPLGLHPWRFTAGRETEGT